MALVSSLQDKDGVSYDIAAKRMSGTRTITLTGDVTGSTTTTLEGAVSVDTGIADNAVDTSCISDGAVTTSKIADTNVTLQKLSSELQTEVGKAHTHTNKSLLDNYAAAGSASIPTYIANDGTPTACTDDFVHDAELTAEATARANADTQLQTNIDAEATTRGNADTALGNRITVLEAKTALSDFEDDITQQTYDATSEDPISGKGVAEAMSQVTQHRVYTDSTAKIFKLFTVSLTSNLSCPLVASFVNRDGGNSNGQGFIDLTTRYPELRMLMGVVPTSVGFFYDYDSSAYTITIYRKMDAYSSTNYSVMNAAVTSRITYYDAEVSELPATAVELSKYRLTYGTSGEAVGSSTAPVYVNADGQVTACGSSLAVSVTGNAATATKVSIADRTASSSDIVTKESDGTTHSSDKFSTWSDSSNGSIVIIKGDASSSTESAKTASLRLANGTGLYSQIKATGLTGARTLLVPDASGTIALQSEVTSKDYITKRLLTSSDDIAGTSGQFTNFYFNSSSVPTRLPDDFPASTGGYGEHIWGQDSNQERVILYANNVMDYHWEISTSGTALVYKKVYTIPDTTYSNTSDNALSAAAAANRRGLSIISGWESVSGTAWIPVAQVVTTNTVASYTGNFNLTSQVTICATGGEASGNYDCSIRFNSGTPTISNHSWGAANSAWISAYNRPFVTVTKNDDNITWTIKVYIQTNQSYTGVRFWNFLCTTYSGSKAGTITELTHTKTTTEPTGDYTSLATSSSIAKGVTTSFGAPSQVGSSTKPVYMTNTGTITECGNSLAVSVTGNAATATKATQDASGNVITSTYATKSEMNSKSWLAGTLLTSSNDLDDCLTDSTNAGSIKVYGWASSDHPTHVPSTFANASCQMVVRKTHTGNYYIQEVIPTSGVSLARRVYNNGTWGDWELQYYYATSTYSSTGTQQVNGTAVASALSSYMPLSRLKPSTDMAGFDSDDTNAYTGKAIGQKITDAISGQIGGWLGNKTVAEINAMTASTLKSGDYATMTDGGTITLGSVVVQAGDEIYWVPGSSVWQKKDNSVYVKKTDIAKTTSVGVVKSDSSTDGRVAVDSDGLMSVNGWSTVKSDITTAQTNITTLQSNVATHTTDIATINTKISAMDLPLTGGDGKYIKSIQETDGVVTAIEATLDTEIGAGSYADNAPTSAAVKTYTDAQVSAEATARDTAITNAIAQEATARDAAISSAIATEVTNRNTAIANAVHVATYIAASETLRFNNMSFTV